MAYCWEMMVLKLQRAVCHICAKNSDHRHRGEATCHPRGYVYNETEELTVSHCCALCTNRSTAEQAPISMVWQAKLPSKVTLYSIISFNWLNLVTICAYTMPTCIILDPKHLLRGQLIYTPSITRNTRYTRSSSSLCLCHDKHLSLNDLIGKAINRTQRKLMKKTLSAP